jgi:hypothetical protein
MNVLAPQAEAIRLLTNKKLWQTVTNEPQFSGQRRLVIGYKTTSEKNIVSALIRLLGGDQKITKKDEETNPGTLALYIKPADLDNARKPYEQNREV